MARDAGSLRAGSAGSGSVVVWIKLAGRKKQDEARRRYKVKSQANLPSVEESQEAQ